LYAAKKVMSKREEEHSRKRGHRRENKEEPKNGGFEEGKGTVRVAVLCQRRQGGGQSGRGEGGKRPVVRFEKRDIVEGHKRGEMTAR